MVAIFGFLSLIGFFACIVISIINAIKKKPVKPYAIGIGVCFVVFVICMVIPSDSKTESTQEEVTVAEVQEEETNKVEDSAITEDVEEDVSNPENNKDALKEEVKDKENLVWFGDVRNDVTGNYRLAEYASSDTLETFAVDYYNAFFEDDAEIHAVINMTTKVTGSIKKMMDDTLDVTLYEYVDDEEHDAKELFSGMKLKEYFVTISTGAIETVE